MVGEGEEEKVPFKLREGEGTREGVLAHIGDPDTLYVDVNVDTEEGEGRKGVPLPLTLTLLTTLLDTVGLNEGL